ncbi:hypothetical protein BX616_009813 [Lobosporangium transversale]|nr:hypothetical protein BX616_009813 [Lobosporangium transversale]
MSNQTNTTNVPAAPTNAKAPKCPLPYRHEDLILIHATVPEVIQRTWTNNMEEWAKGVPMSQYHARERHLASTAFSSDNRLKTWVLVPKPDTEVTTEYKEWAATEDPEKGVRGGFDPQDVSEANLDRIMAAVETYERPGIMATVGETEDGVLRDVNSVSVASVYGPSKFRNHGYGKLMMKLLWKKIENMGAGFSFLYSDLGKQFYTNFGWTARLSSEIVIPPSLTLPESAPASQSQVALEPIVTEEELLPFTENDTRLLRQTLKEKVQQKQKEIEQNTSNGNTTFVAILPEIRCIEWLHARAWFYAKEIRKFEEKNPKISINKELTYGIHVSGKNDQFVLWHHDFTDDNLFILRWRIDGASSKEESDAIALAFVAAAQKEAKKWNISKIVYWNGDVALAELLGLEVQHRNHSICSLGLVNSDQDESSIEWILNEKYSW